MCKQLQYCGPLGKLANCQASVVLAYASERGATLLDRRLYLPREWFDANHRERWLKCGIPNDVTFRAKPALGAEMLQLVLAEGGVPLRWVAMDEGDGAAGYLLDLIHRENKLFFAEIPRDKQAGLRRPKLVPPLLQAPTGRPPTRTRLAPDTPAAQRIDEIAAHWRPADWQPFIVKEGSKGPLEADFAWVQVTAVRNSLPGPRQWATLRRSLTDPTEIKYDLSNAPAHCPSAELVRVTGLRWPIETALDEGKGEVGLDHYETRSWPGWRPHVLQSSMAHLFRMRLRLALKKAPPSQPPRSASLWPAPSNSTAPA